MYLYGASGHAKAVADIIESNGEKVFGVFDDNKTCFLDYLFLGKYQGYHDNLIITIGENLIRREISRRIDASYGWVISNRSNISKRAEVEKGTVIMPGCTINAYSKIGKHNIINTNACIDHDCVLQGYVHISPNVALAGNVIVGEGSHIGIGASVIQGISIGKWVTVGAGSVIIKDIPDFSVVVGNPGRIIKYKNHEQF